MNQTSDHRLFDQLLDPIVGIENVLKEVSTASSLSEPKLLFVRFREHEPQVFEFVDLISNQLVNYVVPLEKRRRATRYGAQSQTQGDTSAHSRLQREAIKLLIKFNQENTARYGEVGELISYVIAVHYLDAAQIGSKMALKTSTQMPIHGVDGLHARAEQDGTITFFVLESKLAPTSTDATREFCESASKYQADRAARNNELRIATDLSNLDALPEPQRQDAKDYFDPYSASGASLKRRERNVGSLVFTEQSYETKLPLDSNDMQKHEKNFESLYVAKHEKISERLILQAQAKSLDLQSCVVFLIGVPDVEALKVAFSEANSGHIRD